jgi:hypothetical protein
MERIENEEFHNLYPSPKNIMVIKSRRMRWEVHVACMGEMRKACKIVVVKSGGKRLTRKTLKK